MTCSKHNFEGTVPCPFCLLVQAQERCKHKNVRIIKTDKGGIFIESSYWCRDCGAIKTGKKWILPRGVK